MGKNLVYKRVVGAFKINDLLHVPTRGSVYMYVIHFLSVNITLMLEHRFSSLEILRGIAIP